MYKQFCKGLKRFIQLNNDKDNLRLNIAKELLLLTDIDAYKQSKDKNLSDHEKIDSLIAMLSCHKDKYPYLERFLWELWAYGFDRETENTPHIDDRFIDEKIKLIDLMISSHYIA